MRKILEKSPICNLLGNFLIIFHKIVWNSKSGSPIVLSFANGQSKFIIYDNVKRATLSLLPCELLVWKGFYFSWHQFGFRNIFMGHSFYESTVSIFTKFVKEEHAKGQLKSKCLFLSLFGPEYHRTLRPSETLLFSEFPMMIWQKNLQSSDEIGQKQFFRQIAKCRFEFLSFNEFFFCQHHSTKCLLTQIFKLI